jgi:hypothetical protein
MTAKKEYTNDPQANVTSGAIKYDGGKAPIFRGAISYFPRAIEAVAAVSNFGATKYAWKGWESVDNGYDRYSDALVRHLAHEGKGEVLDPDSGFLHAAHTAWNALARLELVLRAEDCDSCGGLNLSHPHGCERDEQGSLFHGIGIRDDGC